jgi:hypothetical protein
MDIELDDEHRDAIRFLTEGEGPDDLDPIAVLCALADLAADGHLSVFAVTKVPTQDGNPGMFALAFDFNPSEELLEQHRPRPVLRIVRPR